VLLWPAAAPRAGRNNLSRELNSLRHRLEPPRVPAGAVILATHDWVQLNPAACVTDVAEFEATCSGRFPATQALSAGLDPRMGPPSPARQSEPEGLAASPETAGVDESAVSSLSPPPVPLGSRPAGNLPLQFTRFFGRDAELVQLGELLLTEDVRLVTLTGPGGSGKTRLALQVARQMREPIQEAVWFVPLLDLSDPRLILEKVRVGQQQCGPDHLVVGGAGFVWGRHPLLSRVRPDPRGALPRTRP
jgi:hypothetical protein